MTLIIYIIILFIELVFLIILATYLLSLLYSSYKGSAYVATKSKIIDNILKKADLKEKMVFFDLGCGDGRIVRKAVENYQVKGIGVDVNPLLIFIAQLISRFKKIDNLQFVNKDIFEVDLAQADVIYLFLMPKLIDKLKVKLKKQTKNRVKIISHGFKINGWESYLYDQISAEPFNTYFYSLEKKKRSS